MRKTVLVLLILFMAYVIVTRFVEVDDHMEVGSPAPYPCAKADERPRPADGFYSCELLEQINQSYLTEIKPIFEQKCLMCHGQVSRVPLYSKIPPSSWLVERDQLKAKEDLNMLWDMPFRGEEGEKGQKKALQEIQEVVEDGSMPPLVYRIMHWESELNKHEREKIIFWVHDAVKLLNTAPPEEPESLPAESQPESAESEPTAESQAQEAETLPETQDSMPSEENPESTVSPDAMETPPEPPPPPPEPDGSASDFL